jgi:hypothetical protein
MPGPLRLQNNSRFIRWLIQRCNFTVATITDDLITLQREHESQQVKRGTVDDVTWNFLISEAAGEVMMAFAKGTSEPEAPVQCSRTEAGQQAISIFRETAKAADLATIEEARQGGKLVASGYEDNGLHYPEQIITFKCGGERPVVNTSSAVDALRRHAMASEGHQDAKGARRAIAEHSQSFSRPYNTGHNSFGCGSQRRKYTVADDASDATIAKEIMAGSRDMVGNILKPEERGAVLVQGGIKTEQEEKKAEKIRGIRI